MTPIRSIVSLLVIATFAASCSRPVKTGQWYSLSGGTSLANWEPVNVAPDTFTVADGKIMCTGVPTGIMRTRRHYENFVLELEWRHLVPGGNAGLFVWADPLPALGGPFTRGVEVQVLDGHNGAFYTSHGDVFPIWGATMIPEGNDKPGRAFPTERRSRPAPEWNHYRVECIDGRITLAVNGKIVTRGHSASPRRGYICLESEGGKTEWRNIRIKELPDTPGLASEHIAETADGWTALYTGVGLDNFDASTPAAASWKPNDWRLEHTGDVETELWTDRPYRDYELTLDFRLPGGATGVFYPRGEAGPGVELSTQVPGVGPGRWNRLRIKVSDGRVTGTINDRDLSPLSLTDPEAPVGLGAAGNVQFANVMIRVLR